MQTAVVAGNSSQQIIAYRIEVNRLVLYNAPGLRSVHRHCISFEIGWVKCIVLEDVGIASHGSFLPLGCVMTSALILARSPKPVSLNKELSGSRKL